ncbi:oligosaccharide flippase family protein [Aliivibrio fischeri]|uniref:oligosaccharide flippase family protein n=1 Tax=Aliivibrio fischeri TaxID=668 RepID=UPI0007C58265|nr:oligosaccharide flippase family protein [Aliivibrio fischeri]MBP3140680.1 oligosaccharide flippase family protein [Aliivibrio fischeri]MBP3156013.1 oligosaccharide flippase family protein [Aliivibrio fischeri]MCE7574458.1 oligosaccharide flippase family protein [Aliivibrio fischeri]
MKSEKIKILKNFNYLIIIQVATLLVPFIFYPYVIKLFGASKYGELIFIQLLFSYVSIIIDFGFNLSGPKYVSKNQKNIYKLSRYTSSVLLFKILVFLVSGIILFVSYIFSSDIIQYDVVIILLVYLSLIHYVFNMQWLYQGMEQIKIFAIINLISKMLLLLFIFSMVKSTDDFLEFVIVITIIPIVNSIFGYTYAINRFNLKNMFPNWKIVKNIVADSNVYFISRLSSIFILKTTPVLIGFTLGTKFVAYYDLAEKIINVLLIPLHMLNQVIYPYVVRTRNYNVVKKVILFSFPISGMISFVIFIFSSDIITEFAGVNMLPSVSLLSIFLFLLPINSISYFLGNCILIPKGKKNEFKNSVLYGLVGFLLYFSFIFAFDIKDLELYTLSVVLNSFLICMIRVYYSYRQLRV